MFDFILSLKCPMLRSTLVFSIPYLQTIIAFSRIVYCSYATDDRVAVQCVAAFMVAYT